jgi:zinc/manganese transport system permease protein
MFTYQFVRDAYLEGTLVALACGLAGWFLVRRGQVFAGDALSHVAFTGAIAAALIGVSVPVGATAAALIAVGAFALAGRRARATDVTIGMVFSWILGLGVCFVALAGTRASGSESAITAADALLGSIFSLSHTGAVTGRPSAWPRPSGCWRSRDRSCSARWIRSSPPANGSGCARWAWCSRAAGSHQRPATGALLLIGLLAAPAGAAHRLTTRPMLGLTLAAAIALGCMWAGLAVAYAIPTIPPSTAIMLLAAGAYAITGLTAVQPPPHSHYTHAALRNVNTNKPERLRKHSGNM